jgi:hypothetical protein
MTAADLLTEPATGTDAAPDRGLIERVRRGIIGDDEVLAGPFGPRWWPSARTATATSTSASWRRSWPATPGGP